MSRASSPRAQPLRNTEAELDAFDDTCHRLSGFEPRLSTFFVEGWLTALASGPVRPPAEQWIELLCGDAFERAFADPPDRERATAALETRLAAIFDMLDAEALLDRPDELRLDPLLDAWDDEDRREMVEQGMPQETVAKLLPGALWAEGLCLAIDVLAEAVWQLDLGDEGAAEEEFEHLTAQIGVLALEQDSDDWRAHMTLYNEGKAPERDALLFEACMAVQDLRLFLLDFGPRPATRRVAPQPGRNDPCPCGSGKKYKKCHGAMS